MRFRLRVAFQYVESSWFSSGLEKTLFESVGIRRKLSELYLRLSDTFRENPTDRGVGDGVQGTGYRVRVFDFGELSCAFLFSSSFVDWLKTKGQTCGVGPLDRLCLPTEMDRPWGLSLAKHYSTCVLVMSRRLRGFLGSAHADPIPARGLPGKPESTEGGRRVSILKRPEGALLNLG